MLHTILYRDVRWEPLPGARCDVGARGCAPVPAPRAALPPRYNEINAISTACSYGIAECQQLATALYQQWRQNVSNNP